MITPNYGYLQIKPRYLEIFAGILYRTNQSKDDYAELWIPADKAKIFENSLPTFSLSLYQEKLWVINPNYGNQPSNPDI